MIKHTAFDELYERAKRHVKLHGIPTMCRGKGGKQTFRPSVRVAGVYDIVLHDHDGITVEMRKPDTIAKWKVIFIWHVRFPSKEVFAKGNGCYDPVETANLCDELRQLQILDDLADV